MAFRKTRYWVCNKCSAVYNRRKDEPARHCWRCRREMRKARVYPYALARRERNKKARVKAQQLLLRKQHNRCRSAFGTRLRVSTATRKSFRHLKAAKQRRSFTKRANAFLMALRDDIWTCPHQRSTATNRQCGCKSLSQHVLTASPKCVLELKPGYRTLGQWSSFPPVIDIQWKADWLHETFIHECVHYIDYLSDITQDKCVGSHSNQFYQRCQDLARLLGHKEMEHYKS